MLQLVSGVLFIRLFHRVGGGFLTLAGSVMEAVDTERLGAPGSFVHR